MKCNQCGFENAANVKFCGQCGAPLDDRICPTCGKQNDPDSRFCEQCGATLFTRNAPPVAEAKPPIQSAPPPAPLARETAPAAAPAPAPRPGGKRHKLTWLWAIPVVLIVMIIGCLILGPRATYFPPQESSILPIADTSTPTNTPAMTPTIGETDDLGLWVPYFTLDQPLPAGFWAEGNHTYQFVLEGVDCNSETTPVNLDVTSSATNYPGVIYLRPTKLSQETLGGDEIFAISPSQATIPRVSFLTEGSGYARAEAQALLDSCAIVFCWDNVDCKPLTNEGLEKWTP